MLKNSLVNKVKIRNLVTTGAMLVFSACAWAQPSLLIPPFSGIKKAPENTALDGAKAGTPATPGVAAVAVLDMTPEERVAASKFLSQYKMGPGDIITIRVFGEDDLSREKIRINDTGTIFVPAVGELSVMGLTLGETEKVIADGLRGRILVNPQVSVFVEEYRPFFINGKVSRPGGYPFQPGLSVRKAAALAGGFLDRASLSKIFVIRSGDPQQASKKVELNDLVYPGDIITVEESFF